MVAGKVSKVEVPSAILESASSIPPNSQEILAVEQELIECMRRKKQVDRQLLDLEVQLYNYETSYFQKYPNGNLLKGFESLLSSAGGAGPTTAVSTGSQSSLPSVPVVADEDRLFSNSSLTFHKALQLKEKMNQKLMRMEANETEDFIGEDEDQYVSPGMTTASGRKLGLAGTSSLSRKLQKNKSSSSLSPLKKSLQASQSSGPEAKKVLRIRTRVSPSGH